MDRKNLSKSGLFGIAESIVSSNLLYYVLLQQLHGFPVQDVHRLQVAKNVFGEKHGSKVALVFRYLRIVSLRDPTISSCLRNMLL